MRLFFQKTKWSFGFLFVAALLLLLAGHSSAPAKNREQWGRQGKQYEELTEALLSGRLSLTEEPAAFLAELENPYDPAARDNAAREQDAYYLNDTAYYKGKYYCYFGLTPALLLFLPVRLLTGKMLSSWMAVHVVSLLCVPAALFFVSGLRRRFAKDAGNGTVLLLSGLLLSFLGLPYLTAFCTSYSLPTVTGLALLMAGTGCFLRAEGEDGGFRRSFLAAGAVLYALTIGCRPLYVLSFLLLFPLFSGAIRRGAFFRKEGEGAKNTVCVLLPALALAALFLGYNALRFGSPLEFGFRFLLTTRDMLHGTKSAAAVADSLYLLAFQAPRLNGTFPFLHGTEVSASVREHLYVEPLLGGFFGLHPALLIVLLVSGALLLWRYFRGQKNGGQSENPTAGKTGVTAFAAVSAVIGLVILLADAVLAGVSQRYAADFALFFFIPFACVMLRVKKNHRRILPFALAVLLVLELFLSAGTVLSDGRYYCMRDWNTAVYESIASFFTK
ncbi:MAG: hypothetical protein IK016_02465 [Lachnospiraceae bacterium]|nr:hypothetical protein [Lachnospiraceae bacterium]